jgi:hypothetical protein
MLQVSIYVAVITAAAGVLGAAVPAIATLTRDVRQAERDRRERRADAKRQACIELLRAAGDLRTQVANAAHYHGDEIGTRLAQIRECAEAVGLHAVSVGMLASEKLTAAAEHLAAAAENLVAMAVTNTDMRVKAMTPEPDYTEFDDSIAAFRRVAVAAAVE